MKIYSSFNNNLSIEEQIKIFETCKEQGLWVMCDDLLSRHFGWGDEYWYICPDYIYPEYYNLPGESERRIRGNSVHAKTSDLPVPHFVPDVVTHYIGSGICISSPVTTFTTEELFGLGTDAHKAPFKRIEGKNLWMLASGPEVEFIYVNVIDASDPERLHANIISDEYVHFNSDDFCESYPSEMFEEQYIPWAEIQACHPIQIFTDEEMDEFLATADELYENQDQDW